MPGWDVAGTVVATAGDYTGFSVGDGVFGMVTFPHPGGAYAEYVLAPAYQLAKVPSDVPCAQLGGAPLAALTAYQSLFEVARLKEGERVLIHAGAGASVTSPCSWPPRQVRRFCYCFRRKPRVCALVGRPAD